MNIYPLAELEAIIAAREQAAKPPIPDGYVDKDGVYEFFSVTRHVWKTWIRQGKIRFDQRIAGLFPGGKRTVYALADLETLKQELFGETSCTRAETISGMCPAAMSAASRRGKRSA